jgi:hypothetical protein
LPRHLVLVFLSATRFSRCPKSVLVKLIMDSTEVKPTSNKTFTKKEVSEKGILVSKCMLDNSLYTVLSVGIGLAIFMRTKSKRHFIYSISLGTFTDLCVGFYGTCRPLREDFEAAKANYELINPPVKQPSIIQNLFRPFKASEMTTVKPGTEPEPTFDNFKDDFSTENFKDDFDSDNEKKES